MKKTQTPAEQKNQFANMMQDVFSGTAFKKPVPEADTTGFIAPLVYSHDAFTLIERLTSHMKTLLDTDSSRIISLVNEIQSICEDANEEIAMTGLSW